MTELVRFHRFRRRYLALTVGLMMLPTAHAMQELSDHSLSDTTGEGVALVLDNFKMVFQGSNDLSAPSSYNQAGYVNPSQADTGFIRLIPTGENYTSKYNAYIAPSFNAYNNQNYTAVYNTKYNALYNSKKQDFIDFEKNPDEPDSYWTLRYNARLTSLSGIWPISFRESEARRYATNDVNATSGTHYTTLNNRVNAKLAPLLDGFVALATQQAKDQIQTNFNSTQLPTLKTNFNNALKNQRTKADVFIYGLALSGSNSDLNERFSNTGFNWGTAENPWLIRAGTEKDLKQFTNVKKDLGYLALEAPLTVQAYTKTGDVYSRQIDPNSSSEILNLQSTFKLGLWTDIFSRSLYSNGDVNPVTGAPVKNDTDLTTDQRLRLQLVANGLSINGSQAHMFQTLESNDKNSQYNQTLGMALLLRINTDLSPESVSYTNLNDGKAIRISTAAKTDTQDGTASTPSLDGSFAPIFSEEDGMILYSPNINLVLGNMNQPFIVGSEGRNIILEVTEIPNVADIYNKIYTDYSSVESTAATLCNYASCGTNTTNINGINYQGNNATHSSITIGTVNYDPRTNMIKANTDANASGVVFRDIKGVGKNLGSVAIDGVLIQHLKFKTTGL